MRGREKSTHGKTYKKTHSQHKLNKLVYTQLNKIKEGNNHFPQNGMEKCCF